MGAQVKKTVTNRKERLPHTSDNAPIRGADMNDSRPLTTGRGGFSVNYVNNVSNNKILLFDLIQYESAH